MRVGSISMADARADARHRRGERLRAAHAAQARGQDPLARGVAAEVLARGFHERLVRALQDALRADVDPRAGRHLAVHDEALGLELAKVLPGRPLADEVRVRDEHARRVRRACGTGPRPCPTARAASRRRPELAELAHDDVERLPRARGLAGAAVDDEVVGALGHLGIEVVVQHAEGGLLDPAFAGDLGAAGRVDGTGRGHGPRTLVRGSPTA